MALQINKVLTTTDGGTVDSGAIIKFTTIFPEGLDEMHFNIKVFRNQAAIDSGKADLKPVEITQYGIVVPLTPEQLATLTLATAQSMLKDVIGAMPEIGVENLEII